MRSPSRMIGAPVGGFNSAFSNTAARPAEDRPQQTVSDRDLMGCDLQATLPGFRSDVLHLSNRSRWTIPMSEP